MVGNCTFIRLLAEENKGAALQDSIITLRNGETSSALFPVAPDKFSMVPGSPFAYWASDRIRRLFIDLPPFEGDGRTVKQGLATADDFRFVRAWWEVDPGKIVTGTPETAPDEFRAQTCAGKKWVPFAKGGEYSPYYADVHLVVNWGDDGEEIKNWICERYPYLKGNWEWVVKNTEYYFRPGLTWPRRSFTLRAAPIPKGCIFSHAGMMAFVPFNELNFTLALFNSSIFDSLIRIRAITQFEVGLIQTNPFPADKPFLRDIGLLASKLSENMREIDSCLETCRDFSLPNNMFLKSGNLKENFKKIKNWVSNLDNENLSIQNEINNYFFEQYSVDLEDQYALTKGEIGIIQKIKSNNLIINKEFFINSFVSYCLGAIFGRWDIRYATGEKQPPELPDPFAPLPACSPGMLQGEDGLPLAPHEVPADYPLAVDADGILVDDEGHPDDIVARIRDVLTIIWGDRADAIEKEACEILGVKSLRDYFRKPGAGGFWDDHVKRYSKSRRKAPIYWLLQSAKKNYAIWIYYPRMDADTLYKALRYAKDKLAVEERRLEDMQGELAQLGTGGPAVKRLEKGIDTQEAFISELHDFVEKLERAANLNLVPEHDDGVMLTIAPLWELVPWKEPKNYWDELIEGKYEWSSIGKQLAEKGMRRS